MKERKEARDKMVLKAKTLNEGVIARRARLVIKTIFPRGVYKYVLIVI